MGVAASVFVRAGGAADSVDSDSGVGARSRAGACSTGGGIEKPPGGGPVSGPGDDGARGAGRGEGSGGAPASGARLASAGAGGAAGAGAGADAVAVGFGGGDAFRLPWFG